jgi:hypothetical protein
MLFGRRTRPVAGAAPCRALAPLGYLDVKWRVADVVITGTIPGDDARSLSWQFWNQLDGKRTNRGTGLRGAAARPRCPPAPEGQGSGTYRYHALTLGGTRVARAGMGSLYDLVFYGQVVVSECVSRDQ